MVEICAVGGFGEVGRNMTAVKVGDSAVIFDMGLHLPNFISLNETLDEYTKVTESSLKRANAIPEDKIIKDWRDNVCAIVIGHAHLDHLGAAPYLAKKYNCPIVCTPFTAEVLRHILKDERIELDNEIIEIKGGKTLNVRGIKLEFIHLTHSTPQTIACAMHTKEGIILYANDYKLDDHPTLGKPPDYKRLKELGGVFCLIQDCLYADHPGHTQSESKTKEMLEAALMSCDKDKALVVTTFSSHIERLKSIVEIGKKIGRKIILAGRSLSKYAWSAEDAHICDLEKNAKIIKYSRKVRSALKEVQKKGKKNYLLVVSGHQGEPESTLSKMVRGVLDWKFDPGDAVVFSSKTIPTEPNISNKHLLDEELRKKGVKIYEDIHASGHSYIEDIARMLDLVKPVHLIPAHGEPHQEAAFKAMAEKKGYTNIHILHTGERIKL
ncbi:MBL fold metallo-hydrolase [Candidatus Woesearchaeota archaeon]|nr:MBL fold metallo-hydrolase [Candidatus Woesearchaeota archaeon]